MVGEVLFIMVVLIIKCTIFIVWLSLGVLLLWPGAVGGGGRVKHCGGKALRHLLSGGRSAIALWDTRLSDRVQLQ